MVDVAPPSIGPEFADSDVIQLVDSHRRALPSGRYTATAALTFRGSGLGDPASVELFVAGPRTRLDPTDIHAVYPPAGSTGAFGGVLPHVVLERAALPWQRSAEPAGGAHRLTTRRGSPSSSSRTTRSSRSARSRLRRCSRAHRLRRRSADSRPNRGTGIGSGRRHGRALPSRPSRWSRSPRRPPPSALPSAEDLALLTHVRRVRIAAGTAHGETAIVVSGRTARPGAVNVAHLVSVERQYEAGRHWAATASGVASVTLISLKRWEFTCDPEPTHEFAVLAATLDSDRLRLATPAAVGDAVAAQLGRGAVPIEHRRQRRHPHRRVVPRSARHVRSPRPVRARGPAAAACRGAPRPRHGDRDGRRDGRGSMGARAAPRPSGRTRSRSSCMRGSGGPSTPSASRPRRPRTTTSAWTRRRPVTSTSTPGSTSGCAI